VAAGHRQGDYAARDPLLATLRRNDRFRRYLTAVRSSLREQRRSVES
jgi:hypothetical protein